MSNSSHGDLERMLREAEGNLRRVLELLPEIASRAQRIGAEEAARRIVAAASGVATSVADKAIRPPAPQQRGPRGFLKRAALETLRKAGERGMAFEEVENALRSSLGTVKESSLRVALGRMERQGEVRRVGRRYVLSSLSEQLSPSLGDARGASQSDTTDEIGTAYETARAAPS